jgi:hypothetical protein
MAEGAAPFLRAPVKMLQPFDKNRHRIVHKSCPMGHPNIQEGDMNVRSKEMCERRL